MRERKASKRAYARSLFCAAALNSRETRTLWNIYLFILEAQILLHFVSMFLHDRFSPHPLRHHNNSTEFSGLNKLREVGV